jgi:hypothetical protein
VQFFVNCYNASFFFFLSFYSMYICVWERLFNY